MTPPFTAILQRFYPERARYVEPIFDAIYRAGPSEIIDWDNGWIDLQLGPGPPPPWMSLITAIESTKNTLLGRYASILISETEFVYVQDDDLIVEPETIGRLVACAAAKKGKIVGLSGCNVKPGPRPYREAVWVQEGPADVVLGRAFAGHRSAFSAGITRILTESLTPGRCDDIHFSLANGGGFVMPGARFTNLEENGVGLCHEPQHLEERDAFAARWMVRP